MANVDSTEYILNATILQDSLLQSYRTFNLTMQSIFIAIGIGLSIAILSFSSPLPAYLAFAILVAVFILSLYLLIRIHKVILDRGEDVSFWHRKLILAEQSLPEDQRVFTEFKVHQKLKRGNADYLHKLFLSSRTIEEEDVFLLVEKGLGHTRKVLDKYLFLGLFLNWILVLGVSCVYTMFHFWLQIW